MRDIEILARFLAFRFFAKTYPGRMKKFLDEAFEEFNTRWDFYKSKVEAAQLDFEKGVVELISVFDDNVARKPDSRQFNRAIFDALIFFHSQPRVRKALRSKKSSVRKAYQDLFSSESGFLKAVESDTAGAPNTSARLDIWAKSLSHIAGQTFSSPNIPTAPREPTKVRSKVVSRTTSRR